jgi:hypothetical protein
MYSVSQIDVKLLMYINISCGGMWKRGNVQVGGKLYNNNLFIVIERYDMGYG